MVLVTTVASYYPSCPIVRILPGCLRSPHKSSVAASPGRILAGGIPALPDGGLDLGDADIVKLLEDIRAQQGPGPHILEGFLLN